ncbi:hypothetical protein B0T17DRAFT_236463 [Bombardia bombarda]|uniref:Uncharacterized protein n=1 Tax=Bombardia bombarda TaxID=252184 RepID=A0AA39XBP6_9PEZI|nr:hypothetical protein B0T17DRAFT_236463 [Bombardia bombarda]
MPTTRIELATFSLLVRRSTTEPSGLRDNTRLLDVDTGLVIPAAFTRTGKRMRELEVSVSVLSGEFLVFMDQGVFTVTLQGEHDVGNLCSNDRDP